MDNTELKKILKQHLEWYKSPTKKGEQADLRQADLRGANLSDSNLSGADLRGADLNGANLNGTNLSKACLIEANLSGADLRGANLSGACLIEARLDAADLKLADLKHAELSRACLVTANLSNCYLREAFLSGANLNGANLIEANLRQADLSDADLSGANLWQANLSGANLLNAILSDADLYGANLSQTNLMKTSFVNTNIDNVDMTKATIYKTNFCAVDLSNVQGLESIIHFGPSTVGIDTIYRSKGQISKVFLKHCGMPDKFIEYLQQLTKNDFEYHSCFISYSIEDQDFAYRLYTDLQNHGVRCWFAQENMNIEDKVSPLIDEVIGEQKNLLLIISSVSFHNKWIEKVFKTAFDRELITDREMLFPILVDDIVMKMDIGWAAAITQSGQIADFTQWKNQDAYNIALDKLLIQLKSEA
jgi:uncharacterized protein YjbI with pentapeptide repeats